MSWGHQFLTEEIYVFNFGIFRLGLSIFWIVAWFPFDVFQARKDLQFCIMTSFFALTKGDLQSIKCTHYRPHTTVKNARNMKSVSQAKLPYFEGIFKLWKHEQQELPSLQMFISLVNQNLALLCVKRPWNGFRFSWNFWCCMRSILSAQPSTCLSNS